MDSRGVPVVLRDMSDAPSDAVREVVPDEIDALAEEQRARLHAAQQVELLLARVEQAGAGPPQHIADVSGVHHHPPDPRTGRSQHPVKPRLAASPPWTRRREVL